MSGRDYSDVIKKTLLPCPFCGGDPKLESSSRAVISAQTERVAYVYCRNCHARSPRIRLAKYGCTSYSKDAVEEAARAWNRRV